MGGHPDDPYGARRLLLGIWQRLRSCQAVVAEIWDGPSSTGMAYANAMRLARQRASRDLVPQDIDYGALGVPIIFPDAYLAPDTDPDRRMSREERLTATDYDEPPHIRKPPLDGWTGS